VLARITVSTVERIPAVDHAGITLIEPDCVIRSLAGTDGYSLVLDNIQRRLHEGPCYESATDRRPYLVEDLEHDDRWPQFAAKALASTPVRTIAAIPILDEDGYAALNLYADHPGALDDRCFSMGAVFARQLADVMTSPRGRKALHKRSPRVDTIGQAKSLLMRQFGLDAAQALSLLVRLSKEHNDSTESVARHLIESEHPGRPMP
jgi:GAF domain-containing protein